MRRMAKASEDPAEGEGEEQKDKFTTERLNCIDGLNKLIERDIPALKFRPKNMASVDSDEEVGIAAYLAHSQEAVERANYEW